MLGNKSQPVNIFVVDEKNTVFLSHCYQYKKCMYSVVEITNRGLIELGTASNLDIKFSCHFGLSSGNIRVQNNPAE